MSNSLNLKILETLKQVIDPEINMNVIEANMIFDLKLESNNLSFTFRPTSPTCPIALKLASDIKQKLLEIKDLKSIEIYIRDHVAKEEIENIINSY